MKSPEHSSALLLAASPPGGAAGSSSRVGVVLEALEKRFCHVDVVSMAVPGDEWRATPGVHLVPWSARPSRWIYLTSLLRGGSTFVGVRTSDLTGRLRQLMAGGELRPAYHLVWSHFLLTAPAGLAVPATARVLDADFSVGAAALRAAHDAASLQRIYLTLDARAILRRERRLCQEFDRVVVASEAERQRLRGASPRVDVVPNTTGDAPHVARLRSTGHNLLFVGTLDYDVNVDAADRLVSDVFPLVQREVPAAELTIAGRNPIEAVRRLARRPGVRLVADAPSLESLYAEARAVVVPLRWGGGTRIKVLEAMARSLAIVATPQALEGLSLTHGVSAMVAADAAGLAEQCVAVLQDPALAQRLGEGARAVWSASHRPELARRAIEDLLGSLLGEAASVPAPARGA